MPRPPSCSCGLHQSDEERWMFKDDVRDMQRAIHMWVLGALVVSIVWGGALAAIPDDASIVWTILAILVGMFWFALVTTLARDWVHKVAFRDMKLTPAQAMPGTRARRRHKRAVKNELAAQRRRDEIAAEDDSAKLQEASYLDPEEFQKVQEAIEVQAYERKLALEAKKAQLDKKLRQQLEAQRAAERVAQEEEVQRLLRPGARVKDSR